MPTDLTNQISALTVRAPAAWLQEVWSELRSAPATATADLLKKRLPATSNSDLAHLLQQILDLAEGSMSWEALGYGLQVSSEIHSSYLDTRQIEMLWSGPPPSGHLAARRIDQALYDLIASAKHEILLVTFAAVKVDRLADTLLKAAQRGVKIRLVLEFAEASEGQLSFDALRAFSTALIDTAEVYYWPVENRERNQAGRPGKLHAKLAAIDNVVLISSANLTDDAFSRNLELGVKLTDPDVVLWAKEHFQGLIRDNTLRRLSC
jgi:cardiolipin synthase A/B